MEFKGFTKQECLQRLSVGLRGHLCHLVYIAIYIVPVGCVCFVQCIEVHAACRAEADGEHANAVGTDP